jgi:GNAT superfamily N-acetyltransferase
MAADSDDDRPAHRSTAETVPFRIRPAIPDDLPAVVDLVRGLADFEKLTPPDDEAAARLVRDANSGAPPFNLLVAEVDGRLVGYAAYFFGYSTFLARASLLIEDVFVQPEARGRGIGNALMRRLAAVAVDRGCARLDWAVLEWNVGAQDFYRKLGADIMPGWWTCRLSGDALAAAAEAAREEAARAARGA